MTDNTENLKSSDDSISDRQDIQYRLAQDNIDAQEKIILECKSVIAHNEAMLEFAVKSRGFYRSQLPSGKLPQSTQPTHNKSSEPQRHRDKRREYIIECLGNCAKESLFPMKGLMIGEIRNLMINKDQDMKVSPNTVDHIVAELVNEGIDICVNPEMKRQKRFRINQEIND